MICTGTWIFNWDIRALVFPRHQDNQSPWDCSFAALKEMSSTLKEARHLMVMLATAAIVGSTRLLGSLPDAKACRAQANWLLANIRYSCFCTWGNNLESSGIHSPCPLISNKRSLRLPAQHQHHSDIGLSAYGNEQSELIYELWKSARRGTWYTSDWLKHLRELSFPKLDWLHFAGVTIRSCSLRVTLPCETSPLKRRDTQGV